MFGFLLQNMSGSLFPVDYKRIIDVVMSLPIYPEDIEPGLELYGHPICEGQTTEFNEKRGIFIQVNGWKLFWDKVGTYQPHYLCNQGHIYDTENGLGYIGDMITVNGKPFPNIEAWAMMTRLEHPNRGRYEINKTDAIYHYESLNMH